MASVTLNAIKTAMEKAEARGTTRYRLSIETGISQAALSRFANGKSGLSMELAEALARSLGLEIVVRKSGVKGR